MKTGIVLVTGGTGGIGQTIAKSLSINGYTVCLQYSSNKEIADKLCSQYNNVYSFEENFLNSKLSLVQRIIEKFGKIDGLINCAGIMTDESFDKITVKGFDKLFSINVRAPFILTSDVFEIMKKNRYGRIINISSFTVKYGMGRNQSIQYAASKAALECLTTGLSRLGAEFNILTNTVRPGIINTGMQKNRFDIEKRINMIPLKRLGEPSEIADMVLFLLSSSADFITGETITVAGGE